MDHRFIISVPQIFIKHNNVYSSLERCPDFRACQLFVCVYIQLGVVLFKHFVLSAQTASYIACIV